MADRTGALTDHVLSRPGLETVNAVEEHRLEPDGRAWDAFVSDPTATGEEQLVTEVSVPVK